MGDVINLATVLHKRRVENAMAELEAAIARRNASRRAELHRQAEEAGAGIAGHVIADAVAKLEETERDRDRDSRYMPAYCDPDNERRGAKYEATRGQSSADLAARIRADIKLAQKDGRLDARLKVSVRKHSYSGGYSIDVRITAIPAGWNIYNPEYLRHEHEHEHRNGAFIPFRGEHLSPEWRAARAVLEELHGAYNRDNSDSMTDYFDVRYYGDVGIYWELESPKRKEELAAALAAQPEGGQ